MKSWVMKTAVERKLDDLTERVDDLEVKLNMSIDKNDLDPEWVPYLERLNKIPFIRTVSCCCGHGKECWGSYVSLKVTLPLDVMFALVAPLMKDPRVILQISGYETSTPYYIFWFPFSAWKEKADQLIECLEKVVTFTTYSNAPTDKWEPMPSTDEQTKPHDEQALEPPTIDGQSLMTEAAKVGIKTTTPNNKFFTSGYVLWLEKKVRNLRATGQRKKEAKEKASFNTSGIQPGDMSYNSETGETAIVNEDGVTATIVTDYQRVEMLEHTSKLTETLLGVIKEKRKLRQQLIAEQGRYQALFKRVIIEAKSSVLTTDMREFIRWEVIGREFLLDYHNRTIHVGSKPTGLHCTYTAQELYSHIQNELDNLSKMDKSLIVRTSTPTDIVLLDGWSLHADCLFLITDPESFREERDC